jgi:hypothetical protein
MARRVVAVACAFALGISASAYAQSGSTATPTGLGSPADAQATSITLSAQSSTRPAFTTFFGDTGLWVLPTAEILPHKRYSGSGYRANWDYAQGLTDVSHFAITGAGGVRDRVEIFGSFRVDTRIDHDRAPIFGPTDPVFGGLVNDYPYVRTGWSGDNVGDLLLGVKVNLMSEWRQQRVAMAVRYIAKLPTGDSGSGAGTGQMDSLLDFIISKEFNRAVELSGTVGGIWRGDPDDPVAVDLSNGRTWGIGAVSLAGGCASRRAHGGSASATR